MDWNLFAAVVIGIVIATMVTTKYLSGPPLPTPEPPSDDGHVGYSSSDPVRNFLDSYS